MSPQDRHQRVNVGYESLRLYIHTSIEFRNVSTHSVYQISVRIENVHYAFYVSVFPQCLSASKSKIQIPSNKYSDFLDVIGLEVPTKTECFKFF